MATKAIIRCKKCGEEFPIYLNDKVNEPIRCKNCYVVMDQFMTNQVLGALATVADANRELYRSHLEDDMPLFEVDFSHTNYEVDFSRLDLVEKK